MIVGITGGVGCGKSTVLNFFADWGWSAIDTDSICHDLYNERNEQLFDAILNRWGRKVFSSRGEVCRKTIAEIVFNDPGELCWLNNLLHPMIKQRVDSAIDKAGKNAEVIVDVPLLFEADWQSRFASIICVWTSEEIQRERLLRRGWNAKEIKTRINSQMSLTEKLQKSDIGLINTGSLELLHKQCKYIKNIIKRKIS
jgi:dephospho-CoA kinase